MVLMEVIADFAFVVVAVDHVFESQISVSAFLYVISNSAYMILLLS